jgi:required for meiotic nuclear division protein 1
MAPLEYSENTPAVLPVSPALPTDTLLARYAFSQALSRSTALSVLEESLEDYLSSVALLPHSLEKTGKPGLSREALIKKLGALMKFRQGLNLNRENFSDTPDLYWTEPELEGWASFLVRDVYVDLNIYSSQGFFKSMTTALEVKARTNAVNEKITYATEVIPSR